MTCATATPSCAAVPTRAWARPSARLAVWSTVTFGCCLTWGTLRTAWAAIPAKAARRRSTRSSGPATPRCGVALLPSMTWTSVPATQAQPAAGGRDHRLALPVLQRRAERGHPQAGQAATPGRGRRHQPVLHPALGASSSWWTTPWAASGWKCTRIRRGCGKSATISCRSRWGRRRGRRGEGKGGEGESGGGWIGAGSGVAGEQPPGPGAAGGEASSGHRPLNPACGTITLGITPSRSTRKSHRGTKRRWFGGADALPDEEVPAGILRHNLYGVDIDLRAVQLAGLSLYIKGRAPRRRGY